MIAVENFFFYFSNCLFILSRWIICHRLRAFTSCLIAFVFHPLYVYIQSVKNTQKISFPIAIRVQAFVSRKPFELLSDRGVFFNLNPVGLFAQCEKRQRYKRVTVTGRIHSHFFFFFSFYTKRVIRIEM